MIQHAEAAIRFLGHASAAALEADDEKFSAVLWRVTLVGGAASHLSPDGSAAATHPPLRQAKRMRNLIVHEHPEIDAETVVKTVRNDLPNLIDDLQRLLQEESGQ